MSREKMSGVQNVTMEIVRQLIVSRAVVTWLPHNCHGNGGDLQSIMVKRHIVIGVS